MKKLKFSNVLLIWFFLVLLMHFINGATLKSYLLQGLVKATLGVFLLCFPVYPENWVLRWGEEKSRRYIRIFAIIEIVLSFFIRTIY